MVQASHSQLPNLRDPSIGQSSCWLKIRGTLMPEATSAECDALFDQYDEDKGGQIDAEEMRLAFVRIKGEARQWRAEVLAQASHVRDAPVGNDLVRHAPLRRLRRGSHPGIR